MVTDVTPLIIILVCMKIFIIVVSFDSYIPVCGKSLVGKWIIFEKKLLNISIYPINHNLQTF